MIKVMTGRRLCWVGSDGGWKVGTSMHVEGSVRPIGDGEGNVLIRHKHTGELEYVPLSHLKDYPMEPIPEPGVADATMGLVKQELDAPVQEWRTPTDDDVIAFVRKYGKRPTCRMANHEHETWWAVTGELLLVDTRSSATCPFYVRTKEPDRQNWFRYCQIAIPAKAKEIVANGNAWFDDLERNYLK